MTQMPLLKPTADVAQALLLQTLASAHKGRLNGIKAELLAQKIGMHARMLRTLISNLREQGVAVVGTPETGYYIAQTPDELNECCEFLRNRALHSLKMEARLRNLPLPTLLGQLNLNT